MSIGNLKIGERNERGETLVQFAKINAFRVMNTFFRKKDSREWTGGSNGETKYKIDYTLVNISNIVTYIGVVNCIK